jgi:hypothetical protein
MIQLTLKALAVRLGHMSVFVSIIIEWRIVHFLTLSAVADGLNSGVNWKSVVSKILSIRAGYCKFQNGILPSAEYLIAPHMHPPVTAIVMSRT